jgi:predicted transcriptional regulator
VREVHAKESGKTLRGRNGSDLETYEQSKMNYGQKIRELRTEAGLSFGQLSKLCGVDRSNIQKLEAGSRTVTEPVFERILAGLGYCLEKRIKKIKNKRGKT